MRTFKDTNGVVHLNNYDRRYRESVCEAKVWKYKNFHYPHDDLTPCDNIPSCLMCIAFTEAA